MFGYCFLFAALFLCSYFCLPHFFSVFCGFNQAFNIVPFYLFQNISYTSSHFLRCCFRGFPGGSDGEESACNAGDPGSIPGSGRSPGEGNGNPLQYSWLENFMNGGAWQAAVHGVPKSQTRLVTNTQNLWYIFITNPSQLLSNTSLLHW